MSPFDFTKDYSLENHTVRLTPLTLAHFEPLFQVANEASIWHFFLEKGLGKVHFKTYFEAALHAKENQTQYTFALFDKRTNEYSGMTRLYDISNKLSHLKIGHTWYGKAFQGTGLNKNCKYLLFEFVFNHLKFERIGFGANAKNEISIRAMKSVGCQVEGYLRSFIPEANGERTDIILLSILKNEWDNSIKNTLLHHLKSFQQL
jgi:RimJ/RimL family protein N-acetyltransferase